MLIFLNQHAFFRSYAVDLIFIISVAWWIFAAARVFSKGLSLFIIYWSCKILYQRTIVLGFCLSKTASLYEGCMIF
ncbi:hypothetical protein O9A_00218 [Bartonella koehlerae C-29]|uniref:Uncharacterized protein n=1 Tax=Bartonella koehlerae C-29 TaxID=1134510 RepID=A0A067WGU8_9HYPH|nr:hypothetical protein O9A_00218 [Bartonella koehlerae C-29]